MINDHLSLCLEMSDIICYENVHLSVTLLAIPLVSVEKSVQIFILMLEEFAVVQTRNPHDCSDQLNMQ